MKTALMTRIALASLAPAFVFWAAVAVGIQEPPPTTTEAVRVEAALPVQYLEVVTADVETTVAALEQLHGVSFGESEAALGGARLARLRGGGRIGVRAPMREDEKPVVRPYVLVDDIEAAVTAAEAAGGVFAMYPTEITGHGRFAIYFQGGIQFGLWQL